MSVATVTAARIYEGQKRSADGESNNLVVDRFPFTALAKTYSHDGQVSDSAPTATAMVTGVKTRNAQSSMRRHIGESRCPGGLSKARRPGTRPPCR